MRRDVQPARERLHIVPATPSDLDTAAAAADPRHLFLRGAWVAACEGARLSAILRGDGSALAAFGLVDRHVGPLKVREVAGSYWPFRSMAVAADAAPHEMTAMFADRAMRRVLGRVWRLGPVFADDPSANKVRQAAVASGWAVLERQLGSCFEIDMRALTAESAWPRASTLKKNRWREKKLGEIGALESRRFTGADWLAEDRDAIAGIERNSWLATEAGAGLQFADERQRRIWEGVAADPELAAKLCGSILRVGDTPAAFTFGLRVGPTLYQIANNYDERFAQYSPGRTLLIREFEQAARDGIERISWGSGDAGYKSEMGAQAGPEIIDLLFVRPKAAAAALGRLWKAA